MIESMRSARRAIIFASCLGMAWTQLTMSPASIEFARRLGANGFHVGILGAVPTGMLFLQFVSGIVANHLRYRRWVWFSVSLIQRTIMVPLAFGPLLFPHLPDATWLGLFIVGTAVNHGMLHFSTPLWMSWMGDYLPHKGLNRFWGLRHLWMQWSAAASLLFGAVFFLKSGLDVRIAFPVLVTIGAVFGVADLLIYLRINEPPVRRAANTSLRNVLSAPFRERRFRSFIGFTCFWHIAAMTGAPFISLFLLDHVGMDLFQLLMLWVLSWVGGAALSNRIGRLVERFGHRPMLILCTAFKSVNVIALMLIPPDPSIAFQVLVPVFMLDALLNSGIAIANNGFLLKNSPSENRTMYVAAGTAVAGFAGGVTAVATGAFLVAAGDWRHTISGLPTLTGYHIVFFVSLVLRLVAVWLARYVHEPGSQGTGVLVTQLIGATPLRFVRLPVAWFPDTDDTDDNGDLVVAAIRSDAAVAADDAALSTDLLDSRHVPAVLRSRTFVRQTSSGRR